MHAKGNDYALHQTPCIYENQYTRPFSYLYCTHHHIWLYEFSIYLHTDPAPTTGIPNTSLPTTAPPATVEIMTLTAACQITDSVIIEGTVRSTASRPVNIVVRGSTYNAANTKLGSGSDFIGIDPNETSTFKIIVPEGCGRWDWKYDAWIDEVL